MGDLATWSELSDDLLLQAIELNFGELPAASHWLRAQGFSAVTSKSLEERIKKSALLSERYDEAKQLVLSRARGKLIRIALGTDEQADIRDSLVAAKALLDLDLKSKEVSISEDLKDRVIVNLGRTFETAEEWQQAFGDVIAASRDRPPAEIEAAAAEPTPIPEPEPVDPYAHLKDPDYLAELARKQALEREAHRREHWGGD